MLKVVEHELRKRAEASAKEPAQTNGRKKA
jgi:hypothetical protein